MIEIEDLRKVYRLGGVAVPALRGISLTVAEGEFMAVLGPSGSGKSTLFHIIGGMLAPTSGSVRIEGNELGSLTDAQRTQMRKTTVGFVFQRFNLLSTLNAEENIRIAQHIAGQARSDDRHFDYIVRILGIAHRLHHKPYALSGGEQQRVAIARAIVNQPRILLADEPTGNLDTENSIAVLDTLKALNSKLGQTVLMITHNPDAAAYCTQRIVRMRDGRIVKAELHSPENGLTRSIQSG